ncbi:MAG: hypothetical protein A2Y95_01710 [Deltaproteobacteria bacterium RBG_13_65_10]|nr:MAG: hypothetical protein A2Y95_01710 [Deltaproteobacteria bacterium RBG_13_65_10]
MSSPKPPLRHRVWPALLAVSALAGCVTLELKEATRPFVGRVWPAAPTIAVSEVRDRRDDPTRFGRIGWNTISIAGDAGKKFRNALLSSLNEHSFNVRYVGPVNVLDTDAVAGAIRKMDADFLLTAAVLDIRGYSTDLFFDPADVDFVAQVNLLDRQGRTVYTRHVHAHDDKRVGFNPAFGSLKMLDDEMERVADYVAIDPELIRVIGYWMSARATAPPSAAPGESGGTP